MPLFYKPADGWAADFIPFYWAGEFHLFYLKDYRDKAGHGEGTPWFHLSTRDFVHFADHGEALERGTVEEQDLYVFTGSVIERDGTFHIFYTGHNPHLRAAGKPEQAIMHASSPDLITWTKDPANPIMFAPADRYEPHDWRDPFVFWNEEAGEYWMLLAARLRSGPSNRRGCTALAASPDLVHWQVREPFWTPGLYFTHECPDLFRMGDYWYQVYSTFSERMITHYRLSRNLSGPWLAPENDSFDGRAFYAAKTAADDAGRRFVFGWDPSKVGEEDKGGWMWGGDLVTHELTQAADGSLLVRPPAAVLAAFDRPVTLHPQPEIGQWHAGDNTLSASAPDSFSWCSLAAQPGATMLETTITFAEATRGCGVILRANASLDSYYQLRLEPGRQRVVFDRWPRPGDQPFSLERPLALRAGQPVHLRVIVEGTVIVAYVDEQVALSSRGYDHRGGDCGLFVSEGFATFASYRLLASDGNC